MADIDTNTNGTPVDPNGNTGIIDPSENNPASDSVNDPANESAELAKLRAEMAKQKAALDKATKEAAESKRALRAKQSAEEIAAEEKRIADEARDNELNELRKRFAVAENSKKIMAFVGDEKVSTSVAEFMFGAADVDAAIDELNKAWIAREKKLRAEFGRLPAPGAGGSDGPTITQEQLSAMTYTERVKFANDHPTEYNKLMGR